MSPRPISVTDELLDWFENQKVWPEAVSFLGTSGYISPKAQEQIREKFLLDQDCQALLSLLLANSNGIPLIQIGVKPREVNWAVRDGECASAKLVNLSLARIQDKTLLKPLNVAFDPCVQYLVGYIKSI